jgi:hypothetical protein
LCGFEAAAEGGLVHVVGERPLAVDLDDGDQLAVGDLEFRVAVDGDLLELEPELLAERPDLGQRTLTEVAVGAVKDRHSDGLRYVIQCSVGGQG